MSAKISNLPAVIAASIQDTDILPLVASAVTSKVTVANLRTKLGTQPPAGGRTVTDAFTYLTNNAVFNVKDYGAFGDNATADRAAILAAAAAALAARTLYDITSMTNNGVQGYTSAPIPVLYFPKGRYKINDEIALDGFLWIVSDSGAIIEQTDVTKKIFSFADGRNTLIRGITFLGGTNQIFWGNANIDATTLRIEHCNFQASRDYAIKTLGSAGGGDIHMSANVSVLHNRFVRVKGAYYNTADFSLLYDNWVDAENVNFAANMAVFVNASGTLVLEKMFGVPLMGTSGAHLANTRWIDNGISTTMNGLQAVYVNDCRFGGEDAGIPVLYQIAAAHASGADLAYPFVGPTVSITNSYISSGQVGVTDSCIVYMKSGLPTLLKIEGNTVVDNDYVKVDAGFNVTTFLAGVTTPIFRYKIDIGINHGIASIAIPAALGIYSELPFSWTPTRNSFTEVIGGGSIATIGTAVRRGRMVYWQAEITPAGGATIAAVSGTSYLSGLPYPPSHRSASGAWYDPATGAGGFVYMNTTGNAVVSTAWAANGDERILSGTYRI